MKKFLVTIPIWEIDILLIVGGSELTVTQTLKREGVSDKILEEVKLDTIDKGPRGACWFDFNLPLGIVWFPNNKPDRGTRTHEVRHVIDYVFTYIGAIQEMEATAYTTEWVESEIIKQLRKA